MGTPATPVATTSTAAPASAPSSAPATSPYSDGPSLNSWDSFPVNGVPAQPDTTTTDEGEPDEGTGDTRTDETPSEEPVEQQDAAASDDLETFIQNEAASAGLDPNNPAHRKILKRIFDSQSHIRTLESERKGQPAATPAEMDYLGQSTEFEQQAYGVQPQPQAAQWQPASSGQATVPGYNLRLTQHGQIELNDVGDEWKEPSDGYLAQNAAWQGALSEGGNFRDVIAVDNSMFTRRLYGNEDHIASMIQKHIRQQFPELLTVSHRARMDQDREFALGELEKAGLKDVRDMFKADNAGQPITFNGIQFDNSAFNRVVSKNPWLLDLRKNHSDGRKAEQLSAIAKVRVAYAIWKREAAAGAKPAVAPAQVQQIMQNGANMERRQQQDRARQGINSSGRGPVNNSTNGQSRSYVQSLQELPDEQKSIDTLLG